MKQLTCFLLALVGLIHNLSLAQAPVKRRNDRPNIIYIMADDLGYGNLSCYNPESPVKTPNLDQLAREGTRFTRFYAGSTVCAPSRCALMTGKHMGHAYIRGNAPGGEVPLRDQDTTLAQRLQKAGYATGMFGKWGLGAEETTGAPHLKGFDAFYGYLNQRHAHHYFTDHVWEVQNRQLRKVPLDSTKYTHDLIMDKAFSFVRSHQAEPFFLYLPITLVHAELLLPEKDMKPFLKPDGSSIYPEKPFYRQPNGTYHTQLKPHAAFAAMVTKMDQDMGRLGALLKELGLDDNTYVFFTSDNGPHKEGGADPEFFNSSGPLKGIKRDLYEGGIRVPMIVKAPGKIPANQVSSAIWASWDVLPTICQLATVAVPKAIDGVSSVTILTNTLPPARQPLYWQFNEGQLKEAVLVNNWKLIRFKTKNKPEVLELYNLTTDLGESINLAQSNPDQVKELYEALRQSKQVAEHPLFDWSAVEQ
ncbi:arylsulfatase [Larkinella knui]|uniref:Sulfatase n=1 Tax=Larkinella knui TaxID=2025310 RepID=A0A3P1CW57_9BACT|nr:arylsulfatase [Larkinella knui]RRB17084.1 sulfatase [Larkinella knui]